MPKAIYFKKPFFRFKLYNIIKKPKERSNEIENFDCKFYFRSIFSKYDHENSIINLQTHCSNFLEHLRPLDIFQSKKQHRFSLMYSIPEFLNQGSAPDPKQKERWFLIVKSHCLSIGKAQSIK
ncbi:hypothetical protein BpHYR1_013483 [Brachionus plicatilis]|uniref:Uncharacterized protein n=1 Tax=Brachionus plicatilis TaxID=10195 RepID=A0A3M7PIH8_BRAPC|nr:hypothetical protein BpHYR1_013483 [Brachionus plicatilis]